MNKAKTIYGVDEIGAIINHMKAEKTISDILEVNLLLHSYTDTYLKVGQIVTLNKINYPVLSVNLALKQFTIEATGLYHMSTDTIPVKILDVTKWNIAINYLYGTRIEINEILANAQNDPDRMLQRFPLIWLFVNNNENYNPELTIDFKTNLKFSIVHLTNRTYKASDRATYVFKPVLQPLWELFIETMQSPHFTYMLKFETANIIYDKYIRYFYGSADKNEDVLSCPTDAIEISIDLNFLKQY